MLLEHGGKESPHISTSTLQSITSVCVDKSEIGGVHEADVEKSEGKNRAPVLALPFNEVALFCFILLPADFPSDRMGVLGRSNPASYASSNGTWSASLPLTVRSCAGPMYVNGEALRLRLPRPPSRRVAADPVSERSMSDVCPDSCCSG